MQDAPDPATTLTQDTSVDRDSSLRGRRQTLLRSGIALLLATGVLATTMLLLRGISNAENTPLPRGHFTEALLLCLPETETESAYTGVSECLRETLFVAEKLGNLQTAREDLGDLVAQRPWLHNYCHLAEHQVGAVIMGDPARVPALLLAHPGNTCSWGIGHGLLETFGSVRPADALWDEVIATCRALQTMPDPYPEVYALCADGIGHAAWDHHRELRGAVGRCEALLEASAVSSCTTGIMMQQYRPAETGEQPELDTADLEQYCLKRWPSTRPESLEGCASGIGYVLSLSLVGDTVSGALSANGTTEAVQLQAARKAVPALASGVLICATLNALAETCHASLLTNLPAHLLTSERAWNDLCTGAGEALDSTCQNLRRPG